MSILWINNETFFSFFFKIKLLENYSTQILLWFIFPYTDTNKSNNILDTNSSKTDKKKLNM